VDSAPIIYVLEDHPRFALRFRPLFERQAEATLELAVSTITIAEVLSGPLKSDDETTARRYRSIMESWRVVDLTAEIAESAARLRASLGLKLPDAIQIASAIAVGADAIATHDRDFSRLRTLPVIS
jgi:predicted nucleic acid-binding protein